MTAAAWTSNARSGRCANPISFATRSGRAADRVILSRDDGEGSPATGGPSLRFGMTRVLYFHGFASSPNSEKVRALRGLLAPDVELVTPDLNVPSFEQLDFEAMVALGVDTGRAIEPCAVVGSSLGALVALDVVRRGIARAPLLLAPALGVAEPWIEHLPAGDPVEIFNHARNAKSPINRAFFEQIAAVDADRDA